MGNLVQHGFSNTIDTYLTQDSNGSFVPEGGGRCNRTQSLRFGPYTMPSIPFFTVSPFSWFVYNTNWWSSRFYCLSHKLSFCPRFPNYLDILPQDVCMIHMVYKVKTYRWFLNGSSFFASVLCRRQFVLLVYSHTCLNALTLLSFLSYPAPHSRPLIMPLHTSLKVLALFELPAKN